MVDAIYSGEAIVKRWGDSSSAGRTVTLQLEDGGEHPFRGYEGERFAIVVVPIGNDEKPMKKAGSALYEECSRTNPIVAKHIMGDAPTREDGEDRRDKLAGAPANAPPCSEGNTSPAKPKKRWHEMPPSQRAALLIRDPEFWAYLGAACCVTEPSTMLAADTSLKSLCGIASKSELYPDTPAHAKFVDLEGDFAAWRQAKQHGAA